MTTVLPGFLDAHVHLALIDPGRLSAGGIGRVLDLGGWAPTVGSESGTVTAAPPPETRYAGQFLGAPGGYPSRASWAPAGSFCPVGSPADAAAAVQQQADAGAAVIKVTLNTVAGPVVSADTLAAIVAAAHERMLPVAAHTEGAGQAVAGHRRRGRPARAHPVQRGSAGRPAHGDGRPAQLDQHPGHPRLG